MRSDDEVRELVRERYGAIAREGASCCAPSSCGCGPEMAADGLNMVGDAYEGVAGRIGEADLNLGCGVPTHYAALRPGETVLDLGSGAGNDVFIARHEVGAEGRVIGVDMTPDMVTRARANAQKLGYDNVEFRLGEIEHLPVEAGSIDVIISNCVLNCSCPTRRPPSPRCFGCSGRAAGSASPISSPPARSPEPVRARPASMSAASPARCRRQSISPSSARPASKARYREGAADRAAGRGALAAYERRRDRGL